MGTYLQEKPAEQTRLTAAIEAAEEELNDRAYRLFGLNVEEIELLKKEVEH